MIQKVKYAIAFLAGAIYASALLNLLTNDSKDAWGLIAFAIVCFGGAGIFAIVIGALKELWDD